MTPNGRKISAATIKTEPVSRWAAWALAAALAIFVLSFALFVPHAFAQSVDATVASCESTSGTGLLLPGWLSSPFVCGAYFLGSLTLWLFAKLLWLAGVLFDFSVKIGIYQIRDYFNSGAVTKVWGTVRDLGNIVFIFFLLWISIQTILGIEGGSKKILVDIIIAALLVNFSLFFTKIIIDTSNIVALQFYNGIVDPNCVVKSGSSDGCLSDSLMRATNLQTIYTLGKTSSGPGQAASVPLTLSNIIIVTIFGSIFYLIAAFILLQASFMFIARTVILVMLAAVSPIAFILNVVPKTKEYAKDWWKHLTNQALVAPIFLLFIWIAANLSSSQTGGSLFGQEAVTVTSNKSFVEALTSGTSINVVFGFFFLIGLMYLALKTTKTYSGDIGGKAVALGAGALGMVAGGAAGGLLRNTLGRGMSKLATNESFKNWASRSQVGRTLYGGTETLAKSSYDIRAGVPIVGGIAGKALKQARAEIDFGKAAGKGGYEQVVKGQVKARTEFAKKLDMKLDEVDMRRKLKEEGLSDTEIEANVARMRAQAGETTGQRKRAYSESLYQGTPDTLWLKVARKNKMAANAVLAEMKKPKSQQILEQLAGQMRDEGLGGAPEGGERGGVGEGGPSQPGGGGSQQP